MERIFIYLTNLSSHVAYLIIFGILVACGLGFPLPEDIPLIAAGYLCWDGTLSFVPSVAITMLGVLIGDSILFFLGGRMGIRMLQTRRVQAIFKPEKIRRVRAYFRKYGDKIVFFARFFAGFRGVAFFMAGALRMKYRRFLFLDSLAAIISVPVWIAIGYGLGYYLGDEIHQILEQVKHFKVGFTLIIFAVLAIFLLRSYIKYRKAKLVP